MCRVEERIYINADGHRSKFEDPFPCDKARKGRLCFNLQTRTTEYHRKKGVNPRDNTPSPINPPTPTGTGSYIIQPRRPSSSGRPPSRDIAAKPEIIINFSDKNKKDKAYISLLAGGPYKQSFDDIAVESPTSDASHTLRTGYPEATLPPQLPLFGSSDAYSTTPTLSHGYHHRHTSSSSSYTGSSRTPSLLVTSDPGYDTPAHTRGGARLPPAIHYSATGAPSSSPAKKKHHARASSNDYMVSLVTPRHDYHDLADPSASSHAGSGASGNSRRRKDQDPPRNKHAEEEENVKQVRFELGRSEGRAKERAESQLAEKEKQRASDREEARRRKAREQEEEDAGKSRRKDGQRPVASSSSGTTKRGTGTRRGSVSITTAQQQEQARLLAADLSHMELESKATEDREREERAAYLRQQQQDPSYYNPRSGPAPISTSTPLTRRNSTSRRDSLTSEVRPNLGRSNSRRTSISQSNKPLINTQVAPNYAQPPSTRTHAPPPVSFPTNLYTRPKPARRNSITAPSENPFLVQTVAPSASVENAFGLTPSVMSPTIHQDPWDARNLREASPDLYQPLESRYTKASGTHVAARQHPDDLLTHGHARRRH
ncbi:hypothetical protein ACEQ8H_006948 [Pleosporales sp. CAS-2024a]